jgi:tetratricopeptide (TPR) repeat protein
MMRYVAGRLFGILIATALVIPDLIVPDLAVGQNATVRSGNKSAAAVGKIAKEISVFIETTEAKNAGSGMILYRQGDLYTVLTAAHVVRRGTSFRFTTPDGQVHQSIENSLRQANNNLDLATVKFRSNKSYPVAKLGSSQSLSAGMNVYVAGFPAQTNTIRSGVWNFTKGAITANANKANSQGYSLIYNNATLPGMSGGPVLNELGEVVAIHGQGDRAPDGQKTGFNLGIVIEKCHPFADEIISVKQLPVLTNRNPKADDYFLAASESYDVGNYLQAAANYERAIKLNPQYAEAYNNRGNLRYQFLNNPAGALADYDKAIALRPNSTLTYVNRGGLKADKFSDIRGAIADFDKSITLNDRDYLVYNNRGFLKDAKLNDLRGALSDYDRAVSLNPRSVLAYNNRGNLNYHKLSNEEAAIADYNQAIAADANSPIAYYNRGDLYYFAGDSLRDRSASRSAALSDLTLVAQLNPKGWTGLIAKGVIALEQRQAQTALNYFNQAASLGADPVDYRKYRGLAYQQMGRRSAAMTEWQKASEISHKLRYRKDSAILQALMKST